MPQPELHREGYAVFVQCCGFSAEMDLDDLVATVATLDGVLQEQIGQKSEDFFPNPFWRGDLL